MQEHMNPVDYQPRKTKQQPKDNEEELDKFTK